MKSTVSRLPTALEREGEQSDLARLVRDALRHLHDPVYLRIHPLAHLLDTEAGLAARGRKLRQLLLDAIAALHPGPGATDVRASRRQELLTLRYVEALEIGEVSARLGMSRREYTRQHRQALDAIALILQENESLSPPRQPIAPTALEHDSPSAHLPLPLSNFIGREQEKEELLRLLISGRLVTLTGPPGTGKTRLALQLAAALSASSSGDGAMFPDGVAFVPLAAIADPDLVVSSIAHTMGVGETPDHTLVESLEGHLARRRILLVLDNFEHVLHAAPIVSRLLTECAQLTVLVTSREALHLSGEQEFAVPPLHVPENRGSVTMKEIAKNEAVRLYVDRASAKTSGFRLTEQNMAAVAELCRRLDGLPLAIELAAARSRVFSPHALLDRMAGRGGQGIPLNLLKGGPRDMSSRQHTLHSAIDWSYRLLTNDEQQLFAQLSVFAGDWTLEDAEAVCSLGGGLDVLDGMTSLLDKSLVQQGEISEREPRFSMLETIREYARQRLEESGDEERIRSRHASHFTRLGQEAHAVFNAAAQPAWLARLEREHNNMRVALSWLTAHGDYDAALHLVAGLWWYWLIRGHIGEGWQHIQHILFATRTTISAERAGVLMGASHLAMMQGDLAAARTLVADAVNLARQVGDDTVLGDALMTQGLCALRRGDVQQAKHAYQASLPLARKLERAQRFAIATRALGGVAQREGDVVGAMRLIEESVGIHQELNDVWELSTDYLCVGLLAQQVNEQDQAGVFFRDSLQLALHIHEIDKVAYLLDALAGIAVNRGSYVQAARLLIAARSVWNTVETAAFRKTVEVVFPENERERRTEWETIIRAQMQDEWEVIRQMVTSMTMDEAVAWALDGPYSR